MHPHEYDVMEKPLQVQFDNSYQSFPRRVSFWLRCIGLFLLLALLGGLCFAIYFVWVSLDAEKNLQATVFTISLVEQFVNERGRWPRSWKELEEMEWDTRQHERLKQFSGTLYEWPSAAVEIRRRVSIDLGADLEEIMKQSPWEFSAIRPLGRHYPYQDYGFIESLQKTIRNSLRHFARD
jgi:hypothetical protein